MSEDRESRELLEKLGGKVEPVSGIIEPGQLPPELKANIAQFPKQEQAQKEEPKVEGKKEEKKLTKSQLLQVHDRALVNIYEAVRSLTHVVKQQEMDVNMIKQILLEGAQAKKEEDKNDNTEDNTGQDKA